MARKFFGLPLVVYSDEQTGPQRGGPDRRSRLYPQDDELLVEQVRKGTQSAFSALVQRHQGAIYSLCYRMTGDPQEAEDLAQEAFLRLYRSLGSFRPGTRLRPWFHRIAVNVCLDALRKRREATVPLEALLQMESQPRAASREEMPEEAYLSQEVRAEVQRALLKLPGDYRAALVLRYLEDLSYQEVAEVLGVPVSTVETRLFRAKKMLATVLAARNEGGKEGASNGLHVERGAGLPLR
jgi:RNA polymerase sigma-70 factor, ECF subfamily